MRWFCMVGGTTPSTRGEGLAVSRDMLTGVWDFCRQGIQASLAVRLDALAAREITKVIIPLSEICEGLADADPRAAFKKLWWPMLEEVLSKNVATDRWDPCPRGKQFDLIVVQVSDALLAAHQHENSSGGPTTTDGGTYYDCDGEPEPSIAPMAPGDDSSGPAGQEGAGEPEGEPPEDTAMQSAEPELCLSNLRTLMAQGCVGLVQPGLYGEELVVALYMEPTQPASRATVRIAEKLARYCEAKGLTIIGVAGDTNDCAVLAVQAVALLLGVPGVPPNSDSTLWRTACHEGRAQQAGNPVSIEDLRRMCALALGDRHSQVRCVDLSNLMAEGEARWCGASVEDLEKQQWEEGMVSDARVQIILVANGHYIDVVRLPPRQPLTADALATVETTTMNGTPTEEADVVSGLSNAGSSMDSDEDGDDVQVRLQFVMDGGGFGTRRVSLDCSEGQLDDLVHEVVGLNEPAATELKIDGRGVDWTTTRPLRALLGKEKLGSDEAFWLNVRVVGYDVGSAADT